ncbi:MAG: DNA polymerase I [SAR202 cluster bacterium]|nr:DNA polymerase I [SAR202 cluster bacterium]|tara:strand:+ start:24435 stop:27191 length:2757 start_codon:yes stop_codon:yes gene_type:complete
MVNNTQFQSERKPANPKYSMMLIDGHAMVYRAWHAIQQPLTLSTTGEDVRAVFGFLNIFFRSLEEWKPKYCAIAFDMKGPTFRHAIYEHYKANRPKMPVELRPQFNHVRNIINSFSIPILEKEGFEADDILGSLCKFSDDNKIRTILITGDTDELQLVSDSVQVMLSYSKQQKHLYDRHGVEQRYSGVTPSNIPDFKALQGDVSDNIPGVPGIGAKTASRLLVEHGSLENIFSKIDQIEPNRIKESLIANKDQALEGKLLATIVKNIPLEISLKDMELTSYDRKKVTDQLSTLEFFTLIPRIPKYLDRPTETNTKLSSSENVSLIKITDTNQLDFLINSINSSKEFALALHESKMSKNSNQLSGIAFDLGKKSNWYLPIVDEPSKNVGNEFLNRLKPIFESPKISKLTHDGNHLSSLFRTYGINLKNIRFDSMIAAHLCGKKSTDLESLSIEYLSKEIDSNSNGNNEIGINICSTKANAIFKLQPILTKEAISKNVNHVMEKIEIPLLPILVDMQVEGITLDTNYLASMSKELDKKINEIKKVIFAIVNAEFNIGSSQQLGKVLFEQLQLPHFKKTKTGYSTDANTLEGIKQLLDKDENSEESTEESYKVLTNVLEYRQLTKIKSTYTDSLPKLVQKDNQKLHTRYNQIGTSTGRLSSISPNVQNIPTGTIMGHSVRKAFVTSDKSNILISADYSQIELRILAHFSEDYALIEQFNNKNDIHNATASSIFEVGINDVTSDMRRIAKIMNFGVLYGLSPFGISQQTGLTPEQGQKFIDAYFNSYPKVPEYLEYTKSQAKTNGFVETFLGRRRYIPEINSSNFQIRSSGERMAVNMPIQGTSADIIKISMINIQNTINNLKLKSKMLIQVHDELIFESPANEFDQVCSILYEKMPNAVKLSVPLDIEIKSGVNWNDMKTI